MNIIMQQNEMVPLRETNHAARKRRIQSNFNESKQVLAEQAQSERDEKDARIGFEASKLAENYGLSFSKRKHRRGISESIERGNTVAKEVLIEAMNETFYNAIILDEDFKFRFRESILNASEEFFNEAFKQGLLGLDSFSESKSVTIRDLYRLAESAAKGILTLSEESEIDDLLAEAKQASKQMTEKVAEAVKEKVAKVVKKEKEIADQNKADEEALKMQENSYIRKEAATLFRSIMTSNSRKPISEDGRETNELNMDMVFSESIIQYTLLEMLNTSRLVEIDARGAQRLASTFSFVK